MKKVTITFILDKDFEPEVIEEFLKFELGQRADIPLSNPFAKNDLRDVVGNNASSLIIEVETHYD